MAEQEFKFPDETVEVGKEVGKGETESKLEIEVVDDTPLGDQNREPLPKALVDELEADDLKEYSEKVQRRLGQMKKVWHDERRAKEAAERGQEEAIRVAQARNTEVQQLRQRLGAGEKLFFEEVTKATNIEVDAAKRSLREAYDAGDSEAITNAQEALTDAKLKLQSMQRKEIPLHLQEKEVQQPQLAQPVQEVDPRLKDWLGKNTWYGSKKAMSATAWGLHNEIVEAGIDARQQPDEYYRRLDAGMRKTYPEEFGVERPQPPDTEKPVSRKSATVVAPATRSTAPNKVRLTQTSLALAKRLGLTPEVYAKEVLKLEASNG